MTQTAPNLVTDLHDPKAAVRHPIRNRDAKYPTLPDQVPAHAGIEAILTGMRIPRMNTVTERRVRTRHSKLSDRTVT